jgi:flagellar biogenesis protein FliO
MSFTHRLVGGGLLAAALTTPLLAEPTPGPPDWADGGGSVYLQQTPAMETKSVEQPPTCADCSAGDCSTQEAAHQTAPVVDSAVIPAVHPSSEPSPDEADGRRLAPPSSSRFATRADGIKEQAAATPLRQPLNFRMPSGSIFTVLSALAMVIGAFLIFAWLLRRGGRSSTAALPGDVVSVLGRVPLAARQFAHLLRVGNKLVLVTLTPTGAETLTEVTDPAEVDRLVGLCQQFNPHSTTKAFEQIFRQLSHESAPSGFLGGESFPQAFSSPAAAYRAHRGDTGRA